MCSDDHRSFKDGAIIFDEGSAGDRAYIVRSGKVRIFRVDDAGHETLLTALGPGEMFGEVVSEVELERLVGDPTVLHILRKMSARIREVDDALEKMSVEGAKRRESMAEIGIRRSMFT
jgi:signal-transduction protein with cAMP-binding, CBS, and nucleotidyltransferase domain